MGHLYIMFYCNLCIICNRLHFISMILNLILELRNIFVYTWTLSVLTDTYVFVLLDSGVLFAHFPLLLKCQVTVCVCCLHTVRLHGSSFLLQIYWTPTKDWRTVCSHGWSDQQGRASCQDIGYSRYCRSYRIMKKTVVGIFIFDLVF